MTPFSIPDPGAPKSGKRILIVEDEPLIAYDLISELEANGHSVVGHTNTADKAIAKAGDLSPDVVIMDIGLLGKHSGIDAGREIRRRFDIGCIFVSATLDRVDPEDWKDIRPVALIRKPYGDQALLNAIAKGDPSKAESLSNRDGLKGDTTENA